MGYALLREKPLIGPKFLERPKSARERAASRWFAGENVPSPTMVASGKVFPGQYFDEETGLHYNHFRYYDPALGRYITSDPVGLGSGLNTYNYSNMSPVIGIDPFGLATYRYGDGTYSDRYRPGDPSCQSPIWAGSFIVGWKDCGAEDICDEDDPSPSGDKPQPAGSQPSKPPSGPGTGTEPGEGSTGDGSNDEPYCDLDCMNKKYPMPEHPINDAINFGMCSSGPLLSEIITYIALPYIKAGEKIKTAYNYASRIDEANEVYNCYKLIYK